MADVPACHGSDRTHPEHTSVDANSALQPSKKATTEMTSAATGFKLTITVTDPQTMQKKIDDAVQKTIGHALHLRQGIRYPREPRHVHNHYSGMIKETRSEEATGRV